LKPPIVRKVQDRKKIDYKDKNRESREKKRE
jgi:hypothetical protein